MSFIRIIYFALLITVLLFTACSSEPRVDRSAQQNLVWPAAPAMARVGYVRAFSKPEDLGIEKGFFKLLGEFFMGREDREMIRPMSVVVTEKNIIYVADPGVMGVHRFDLQSGEYAVIQQENDLPLPSPVALTRGNENGIYVVDSQLAKVFRIDAGAEYARPLALQGELQQPTAIVIDNNSGRYYVLDTGAHQLKVFNADGSLRQTIGRRGSGNGEFNYPTYLWLDKKGLLYISDSLNFRVQVLDTEGNFIRKFGHPVDGRVNMSRPKGVTTDDEGNIYVVDALFHAVQIFNPQGQLLLPVGQRGHTPGEFWLPTGIFLDGNGKIYVADSHNHRVQVFRLLGGVS